MHELLKPTFNLAILIGILAYYLREPLKAFVKERHTFISDEVKKVEKELIEAKEKFDEFSAKLKAVDVETAALREQAKQDAEGAKVRIVADAKRLAANIVRDARASAEGVFSDLKIQLRKEFGERAIAKAEGYIKQKLTADDQARIRRDFSKQVESIQ